jgi:hypothetical protein
MFTVTAVIAFGSMLAMTLLQPEKPLVAETQTGAADVSAA